MVSALFIEGFETPQFVDGWKYAGSTPLTFFPGRKTGFAESISSATMYALFDPPGSPAAPTEVTIGFGLFAEQSADASLSAWVGVGSKSLPQTCVRFSRNQSQVIAQVFRGEPGRVQPIGPAVAVGIVGQWYFYEFRVIAGALGSVVLVVDNDTLNPSIEEGGVSTEQVPGEAMDSVHLHTNSAFHFDDLYVVDSSDVAYPGPRQVRRAVVTAAAAEQDMQIVNGLDAVVAVQEPEGEGGQHLLADAVNEQALFKTSGLAGIAQSVDAVRLIATIRCRTAGFTGYALRARVGSTGAISSPDVGAVSNRKNSRVSVTSNAAPGGGSWTQQDITDLEFGVQRV